MAITVRYFGTQQRWPELEATGNQSVWSPGQMEERSDAEALLLLATGEFERIDPPVSIPVYTVDTLPAAASCVGGTAFVNDADTPVAGDAVVGGGDEVAPVWSNGTDWVVG